MELKDCYLSYDFRNVAPLSSPYYVRIYELLKQYEKIGHRRFSVEDLKYKMELENKYQSYGHFKQDILEAAKRTIKQHCDINFEYEEIKKGRKVVKLMFHISSNVAVKKGATERKIVPSPKVVKIITKKKMDNSHTNKMIIFENQHIRSIEKEGGTWFSVSDVIGVLTESKDPKAYWRQLKKREEQLVTICHGLKLMSNDGKKRLEDCANTEGVLRIIQSVPSPKAEPFKLWLAQVGAQVLEETTQPELSFERLRELYRAKGYSDEWIVSRLKSIGIRKELTDEWKKRGVAEGSEYAHLTAEISRATFSMNPSEYKDFKQLPEKENLRDHMSNLELIFTMLGEEMTRKIAVDDDAQGFNENKDAAKRGGQIAGDARERVETNSGYKVISSDNFLKQIQAVSDEEADKDANKTEK